MVPRFVDDISVVPTIVPPGWKIKEGKLEFHAYSAIDDGKILLNINTMDIINKKSSANMSENLKVTYNVSSMYNDKKSLPQIGKLE